MSDFFTDFPWEGMLALTLLFIFLGCSFAWLCYGDRIAVFFGWEDEESSSWTFGSDQQRNKKE